VKAPVRSRGIIWRGIKEEGIKCFRKALEFDPGCVMAHWGIAYGAGPFYNLIWREHGENEAAAALAPICPATAISGWEAANGHCRAWARRLSPPSKARKGPRVIASR
jgi:hypothetical protein